MSNEDDYIGGLITAGLLVLVGYGVYRVLKSFGTFSAGDEIASQQLTSPTTWIPPIKYDKCDVCGSTDGLVECKEHCGNHLCQKHIDYYWGRCYSCDDNINGGDD
jgi:hypothetical protein